MNPYVLQLRNAWGDGIISVGGEGNSLYAREQGGGDAHEMESCLPLNCWLLAPRDASLAAAGKWPYWLSGREGPDETAPPVPPGPPPGPAAARSQFNPS